MSTSKVGLNVALNMQDFVRSMKRAAKGLHMFAVALHRLPHPIARCGICNPMANPKPLAIDGHAYARRRNNRKGRR
jgi:hypothetical protein